jgi:hypothetical protein
MKLPFEFGEVVSESYFVNREVERKRLKTNLSGGLNTILISPRRWGKSSLMKQLQIDCQKENLIFCFVDLFQIKDEDEFYHLLADEIIKKTSSHWEEWVKTARQFFKALSPKLSMGLDPQSDFKLGFEWEDLKKNYSEVLHLAEKVAKEKKVRIVLCVDEFQNVSRFDDPLLFQQRLRSIWQEHKDVSYCIYGSKKHLMMELFQSQSMPFYKFGDVIFLEKIESKAWNPFIQKKFKESEKSISSSISQMIVDAVDHHPYYVQQLSLLCWMRTEEKVTKKIFEEAKSDLLNQNTIIYSKEVDQLSNTQLNFLEALVMGEINFHANEVITTYKLGSSSNVSRIKEALEKKEIIDSFSKKIEFLDPVFKLWFKERYMDPA